jgi:hypothetical protein
MGKGIYDRNWVTLLQVKLIRPTENGDSNLCQRLKQRISLLSANIIGVLRTMQHGDALARFIQAETLAKEAHRYAQASSASFVNNTSPNLPADVGSSIQEKTKVHLVIRTDKKNEAQRDNGLIYSAICPPFESLSVVERTAAASAIPIHGFYGFS